MSFEVLLCLLAAVLWRRLLEVERAELLRLYEQQDIDEDVLRRLQRQLDLQEVSVAG